MEDAESGAGRAEEPFPADGSEPAVQRRHGGFWSCLAAAVVLHRLAAWSLEARAPEDGEPLALRWLRSLADHPVRGPLGLALATTAAAECLRALLNRPPRT
jgi:hypothetical protein